MLKLKDFFGVAVIALILSTGSAQAERLIKVDFTNAELTVIVDGVPSMSTPVVLPRGNYYQVPVSGTVRRAVMGPIWTPTKNMHLEYPDRYKKSYGPYEVGNAMGHCKLYIDFNPTVVAEYPILRSVRVHGNARDNDLGKRLSRSCIRIPDRLCSTLVKLSNENTDEVMIQFHW